MRFRISALGALLIVSLHSYSTNIIWNGGTGYWDDAKNWNCNCVPNASDTVTINSGHASIPGGYVTRFYTARLIIEEGAKLTIENHAINALQGKLEVANNIYQSIRALGEVENSGLIYIPDAGGLGIYTGPNSKFTNNSSGLIHIENTTGNVERAISNAADYFVNFGEILVENIPIGATNSGFSNNGRFTNIGTLNAQSSAQIINSGYFINDLSGILEISSYIGLDIFGHVDTFINRGQLNVYTSRILLTENSYLLNQGTIKSFFSSGLFSSIIVESGSEFINDDCSNLILGYRISNDGVFINDGFICQDSPEENLNNGSFLNNGSIEDLQFSFDQNMLTQNNGYLIQPIQSIVAVGAAVQHAILGLGIGQNVVGKRFVIDTNSLVPAGIFLNQSNNTWVPDCMATNRNLVYLRIDQGTQCSKIIQLPIIDAIQPGESTNVYNGPINGNWHNSSNWSLEYPPYLCHHVIIPEGVKVTISTGNVARGGEVEVLGELDVQPGAMVNFNGNEN